MGVVGIHHIQLAMPAGQEQAAAHFYSEVLGIPRVEKPAHLAARGGCWFEQGEMRIHLGVEEVFRPAEKAHPAFLVSDLDETRARLEEAGVTTTVDQPLPGHERFYASDPFGNRLEFLAIKRTG